MALTKFRRWIAGDPGREDADRAAVPLPASIPAPDSVVPLHPAPKIPNLRLLRCVGRGAYGEVWLGRDEIAVHVAVKLVYRDNFPDRSPFEREYRGILHYTPLSRTHHGLVQILHVGRQQQAGFFYYVMELADCAVSGRDIDPDFYVPHTLAHELDTRGRLPVRESLTLALELSEPLGYLHSRQLIHRDIKPANIIYVNNLAKLADVGLVTHIAEARRDPKHLGTEGFVPPEGPGTPTADVYSLGKVLTEVCLGHAGSKNPEAVKLFEGENEDELTQFQSLVARACDEDVQLRYKSVQEFEADLLAFHDAVRARKS
ncbi:MAG: eukaryotic-like serine/threonine-protein kinase [Verrucomicrobiota bacterium]|jgi:serine/threonine protein kinase